MRREAPQRSLTLSGRCRWPGTKSTVTCRPNSCLCSLTARSCPAPLSKRSTTCLTTSSICRHSTHATATTRRGTGLRPRDFAEDHSIRVFSRGGLVQPDRAAMPENVVVMALSKGGQAVVIGMLVGPHRIRRGSPCRSHARSSARTAYPCSRRTPAALPSSPGGADFSVPITMDN